MMRLILFSAIVGVVSATLPGEASAETWDTVLRFKNSEAKVVEQTKKRLTLQSAESDLRITLSRGHDKEADLCDVYDGVKQRRGGNPYRVWYATKKFVGRQDLPRKLWGQFFKADFLRLIRLPRE